MEQRKEDGRINQLVEDVSLLKEGMRRNTEVTEQIRDLVKSFKLLSKVAAIMTALISLAVAVKTGLSSFWKW